MISTGNLKVNWFEEDGDWYVSIFMGDNEITMTLEEAKNLTYDLVACLQGIHMDMEDK